MSVAFAAPWLVWGVVRTFGLDDGDLLVSAMAFTPYAALSSPLPVLVALALRRRSIAAIALAACAALASAVLPRAFAEDRPTGAERGATVTVMSINLRQARADSREVLALVRRYGVDVLSVQELDDGLPRLDSAGASTLLPQRMLAPGVGTDGAALLTNGRLRRSFAEGSAVITLAGAEELHVATVHPPAPTNGAAHRAWRADLRDLPSARGSAELLVAAGDFNATLDHSEMRRVLDRGYADAADATGHGLAATWGPGLRITIDHVLVDRRIGVTDYAVHEVAGSDHRAVIAELLVPGP